MAIKFYRNYEDYKEGDVVELDHTMEDYFVRRNFADFVPIPTQVLQEFFEKVEAPTSEPEPVKKPRAKKVKP